MTNEERETFAGQLKELNERLVNLRKSRNILNNQIEACDREVRMLEVRNRPEKETASV